MRTPVRFPTPYNLLPLLIIALMFLDFIECYELSLELLLDLSEPLRLPMETLESCLISLGFKLPFFSFSVARFKAEILTGIVMFFCSVGFGRSSVLWYLLRVVPPP
jgi:hypothetical protein